MYVCFSFGEFVIVEPMKTRMDRNNSEEEYKAMNGRRDSTGAELADI